MLSGCGGSGATNQLQTVQPPAPFTHVYVVFPPAGGVNNTHFMSTVINQKAIEGVTVANDWSDTETAAPGAGTCSPVGTDVCQQDSFGWTHAYDWSDVDAANAQWFAAQGGTKKVNILLYGIGGSSPQCALTNSCVNPITPYYVTSPGWVAHTSAPTQDFINANKDGCTDYSGLQTAAMTRDATGLVTVTENNHGYSNGDLIWVGASTPANYNIAQENVQSVQVAANVLTITADNSFPVGMQVIFQGLGRATFLNGQEVTIASATATQFTASLTDADYGPTAESAGTANPQGVPAQNVTANTFQYQTAVTTAGSATSPGTVLGAKQSWPVPYETPYLTAWEAFIAAAMVHFNNSPNLSQIDYMRVGRAVGGEAYPLCLTNLEQLPAPNTYSKSGWLNYYTEIDDFVQAQNPKMQILDPLNQAGMPADATYGDAEAATAVAHRNASGAVNGFGSQGMQASDITSYDATPQGDCSSDWCAMFNLYYQTPGSPLELQQVGLSAPVAIAGTESATGDLRPLLPFAVTRHMSVLELYSLDALLAYDPYYCVLTVPDTQVCVAGTGATTGSVMIPAIQLPAIDQYDYFQAAGQPGQAGATGDGSYAATINSTEGSH